MSYRNKTYIVFDGDNDMWAYAYMKGWKNNDHIDFDFHDAHDLNVITDRASEETTKRKLRERFSAAKQVVVLIGEHTKNLYRFVRWEIEVAQSLNLPIVAANLNKKRSYDAECCPAILSDQYVVHISFNAKMIQYALDHFPAEYAGRDLSAGENRYYDTGVYDQLGL